MLLIMCGYEKEHGYISVFCVVLNLLLNYFFIQKHGALGAAIATSITVSVENLTKFFLVKRKIGILTIPTFKNMKDL